MGICTPECVSLYSLVHLHISLYEDTQFLTFLSDFHMQQIQESSSHRISSKKQLKLQYFMAIFSFLLTASFQ